LGTDVKSEEFNRLVRLALRNEPLRGLSPRPGGAGSPHHWEVSWRRVSDGSSGTASSTVAPVAGLQRVAGGGRFALNATGDPRLWRIFVSPGTVNDHMAAITYRRAGDPRGWTMPPDHPGIPLAKKIYGPNWDLIDRLLTERTDPPHLLVATPHATDPKDLGDFVRVRDDSRPAFFRTAEMWDLDLYSAALFISAMPARPSYVEGVTHFPLPQRISRYRVMVRSVMPTVPPGVQLGGQFRLATLYLTRDPKHRDPVFTDTLHVRQLCYWSLWTANALPADLLTLTGAIVDLAFATNLLPLTLPSGALAAASILAANAYATNLLLDELANIFDSASTVDFWSAA